MLKTLFTPETFTVTFNPISNHNMAFVVAVLVVKVTMVTVVEVTNADDRSLTRIITAV